MKLALVDLAGRIAQVETVAFPVASPLRWIACADDVTALTHLYNGAAFVLIVVPAVPVPTPTQLQAEAVAALSGGQGRIDMQKLFIAGMVSNLARALGVNPGALQPADLSNERARIAAIYAAL